MYDDLNRPTALKYLDELKWYVVCHYSRDRKRCTLTTFQQNFAQESVKKFRVPFVQNVPLEVSVKSEEFRGDGETGNMPFRELVDSLMWLAMSASPDNSMQFGLLRGTVSHRKSFTGKRRSVLLRTLLVVLASVLHFREDNKRYFFGVFSRRRLRLAQ